MELKDYIRILRRRWWVILTVMGIIVASNMYLLRREIVLYRSNAEVIVKKPSDQYVIYSGGSFPVWETITYPTRLSLIKSEPVLAEALVLCKGYFPEVFGAKPRAGQPTRAFLELSGGVYREVWAVPDGEEPDRLLEQARTLGYEPVLREWEKIVISEGVGRIKGMVSWQPDKDTEIVSITVHGSDPEMTRDVANAVARSAHHRIQSDTYARIDRTLQFLRERKEAARQDVERWEKIVAQHVGTGDSAQEMLIGRESLYAELREVEDLERTLRDLDRDIEHLERTLADGGYVSDGSSGVGRGAGAEADQVRGRLEAILSEAAVARRRYTEDHPLVRGLDAQAADLRDQLDGLHQKVQAEEDLMAILQGSDRLAEMRRRRRASADDVQERRKEYETNLEAWRKGHPEFVWEEEGISEAERRLEESRESVQEWSRTERNLQVQRELQVQLVEIVSPAKLGAFVPQQGGASVPFLLLVGLIVGVGIAYLMEYFSTTIQTEYDIRRYVNLPMLGMILRIKQPEDRLLLNVSAKSSFHEVFNTVGTLVENLGREHGGKVFMVASSRAEEGKSTITTNIGVAMARSGQRVLLLDCDLRKAVLHRFFGVENQRGLTTFLGEAEADPQDLSGLIQPTEIEGLRVIPAGPHPANPVALLRSEKFAALIDRLRHEADVVLVDVPPINIAVDTMILASLVDGIVLLISAGEVSKDEVSHAKRLIEGARGKFLGCLLNKVAVPIYGYYRYYYYYYDTYKYYRER